MMRRWRKWWCCVDGDQLRCVLYESLRISDQPAPRSSTRTSSRSTPAASSSAPATSTSPPKLSTSTSLPDARSRQPSAAAPPPLPFRVLQTASLPLATVTVREARQAALSFCFEAISPAGTLLLQALSQDEMRHWMQVSDA